MRSMLMLAFAVCAISCGSDARESSIDGQVHEEKPSDSPVSVFLTSKPDRPYTEIAMLRFKSESTGDKQLRKLRTLTREKGGDAVYIIGKGSASDSNFLGMNTSRDITEAIVVIWK
jgi:hypothetical protein